MEGPLLWFLRPGESYEKQSSGINGEGHDVPDVDTKTYERRNREHIRKGILKNQMFTALLFMLGGAALLEHCR